jgi:hypothetical protein
MTLERGDCTARLGVPEGELFPRWVAPLALTVAAALIPWTGWLLVTLPDRAIADHWAIAWAGFDVALCALLAGTAWALLRRSLWTASLASAVATMLVIDAWFDVMTSSSRTDLAIAIGGALVIELPLAVGCLWIARDVTRVAEQMRPILERSGFRLHRRRLQIDDVELERAAESG